MQVRRVRTRAECDRLLEITEPLEPGAQMVNARLLRGPGRGRRIYVAEHDGEVLGIAVMERRCLDRWGAGVLLLDERAAEPLARIVDRSPAREVVGIEGDVSPLQSHMRRARTLDSLRFSVIDGLALRAEFAEPDPRSRLATRADVGKLADLYAEYPYIDAPTMFQLRRLLRRTIDEGLPIPILELDGRIVSANRMESRGCRYARWTDAVVHPDYRRRGLHKALAVVGMQAVRDSGLGIVAEVVPKPAFDAQHRANAERMLDPATTFDRTRRVEVLHLHMPRKFPGQGRLRRALYWLGGRRTLPPRREAGAANWSS